MLEIFGLVSIGAGCIALTKNISFPNKWHTDLILVTVPNCASMHSMDSTFECIQFFVYVTSNTVSREGNLLHCQHV